MQIDITAKKPTLCIVVPCFNEAEVLLETAPLFLSHLNMLIDKGKVAADSRILFVDDGSKDDTWRVIRDLAKRKPPPYFEGIRLSRNRGHQNALYAGLMEARKLADAVVSADCDGQDDIAAIEKMVDEYVNGNEIVFGVRNDRASDTALKRMTAQMYYSLMKSLGTPTIYNHADFRLMGSNALEALSQYGEVNLFLRGIVPEMGFRTSQVEYSRSNRMAGSSKYTFPKMIRLAIDGITSFSSKPIHIVSAIGAVIGILGFLGIIWAIFRNCIGETISGWTSLACIVLLLGGLQLISIGIVGEYVGRMYMETKSRPRYIISERTWQSNATEILTTKDKHDRCSSKR